jgi:hypothetical protein
MSLCARSYWWRTRAWGGVPVREGLFPPAPQTWSSRRSRPPLRLPKQRIRIITETGLRIYKELALMKKEDLANAFV